MSLIVFIGPSRIGKTFAMDQWLLPTLLTNPSEVTSMASGNGYGAILIHDPETAERPNGQYSGVRFKDVAEWRRAQRRPQVACFSNPSLDSLCRAAIDYGRMVVCLDEGNRLIGNERKPTPAASELIESGRHHGCVIIAGARRLKSLHTSARSNIEVAYFGALADPDDRDAAAEAADIDPEKLRNVPEHSFLEWRREPHNVALIKIHDRRKITVSSL